MVEELLSSQAPSRALLAQYWVSAPRQGYFIVRPSEISNTLKNASTAASCYSWDCGTLGSMHTQLVEGEGLLDEYLASAAGAGPATTTAILHVLPH
jgi:hypothetical protein